MPCRAVPCRAVPRALSSEEMDRGKERGWRWGSWTYVAASRGVASSLGISIVIPLFMDVNAKLRISDILSPILRRSLIARLGSTRFGSARLGYGSARLGSAARRSELERAPDA